VLPTAARPASEPSDKGQVEIGQITSQALANNLIGDPATRDFVIYLPPSYDTSEKRYPVVFALHGYLGDEWELASSMTRYLDEMVANGEGDEMILVFVDGSNRFRGSWYLSSPTIGDYESYIVRELVDHIDANYRTLPDRDSRGITGRSMGGDGALHLALKYPDVFSVAVPMSGIYIGEREPWWDHSGWRTTEEFNDFGRLGVGARYLIAGAAAAASNPDQPPLYLDMPFEEINGEVQIVQEVYEKVNAVYPANDVGPYLDQPVRLRGLLLYHGKFDSVAPVEVIRDFDSMLTELGVEHEYLEVSGGHTHLDYAPVLSFMSDHLVFE
jgi:enterochelin esterase-like enzyme